MFSPVDKAIVLSHRELRTHKICIIWEINIAITNYNN